MKNDSQIRHKEWAKDVAGGFKADRTKNCIKKTQKKKTVFDNSF